MAEILVFMAKRNQHDHVNFNCLQLRFYFHCVKCICYAGKCKCSVVSNWVWIVCKAFSITDFPWGKYSSFTYWIWWWFLGYFLHSVSNWPELTNNVKKKRTDPYSVYLFHFFEGKSKSLIIFQFLVNTSNWCLI